MVFRWTTSLFSKRLVYFLLLYILKGTGTFGRVKLVKLKEFPELQPMALKILKKKEMIKLKQVDHVKSEKSILEQISHPFIIEMYSIHSLLY